MSRTLQPAYAFAFLAIAAMVSGAQAGKAPPGGPDMLGDEGVLGAQG